MDEISENINILFKSGTLLIDGNKDIIQCISDKIVFDERVSSFRSKASCYADIIYYLRANNIQYKDNASHFSSIKINMTKDLIPREYQVSALKAWINNKYRGVISLPTGSGKSFLAVMAINFIKRNTLIIVPTIDLMLQWGKQIEKIFKIKPGYLGGGIKELKDITISTYDSAVLNMEFIGDKYALLVFDECHHLTGPSNKLSAEMSIAPYRLGLSATPTTENQPENELILSELIGKIIYDISINDLKGKVLAEYTTKKIYIDLTEKELVNYHKYRKIYTDFIKQHKINFSKPDSWQHFIGLCSRKPEGKNAFKAFLEQKAIARSGSGKIKAIWNLIKQHNKERIIIFTADNETAYKLGNTFFLPVLTHKTKTKERKDFLDKFRSGEYQILITSKVLNEGIDVPEANIGIVVSGSASIREHVQRLGRILRPSEDKGAILYELISKSTNEESISTRRRSHSAYD